MPGVVETPLVADWDLQKREKIISGLPIGRMALPDDMANIVSFLICEKSSYLTGSVLNATGGLHI